MSCHDQQWQCLWVCKIQKKPVAIGFNMVCGEVGDCVASMSSILLGSTTESFPESSIGQSCCLHEIKFLKTYTQFYKVWPGTQNHRQQAFFCTTVIVSLRYLSWFHTCHLLESFSSCFHLLDPFVVYIMVVTYHHHFQPLYKWYFLEGLDLSERTEVLYQISWRTSYRSRRLVMHSLRWGMMHP